MVNRIVRITTLVENTVCGRGMLAEHGLAFWLDMGAKHVLFDTGQGMVIEHNARYMDIPLESADAIVLSHGHYDHIGGLAQTLKVAPQAKVFAHQDVFQRKYKQNDDGTTRDVGVQLPDRGQASEKADDFVRTNQPTEICNGLLVTGEIPRVTDFEDTGGPFFLDEQCLQPDPLIDDQAMFFDTPAGTVVVLGCAHAGVINTLHYISELTNNKPIHTVVGGMHLVNASQQRIDKTIEALRRFDINLLAPAHCTGMVAMVQLWSAFADKCVSCTVGAALEFEVS